MHKRYTLAPTAAIALGTLAFCMLISLGWYTVGYLDAEATTRARFVPAYTSLAVTHRATQNDLIAARAETAEQSATIKALEEANADLTLKLTAARKPKPRPLVKASYRPSTSTRGSRTVVATGYCSCSKCCGKTNGITASGARASWGTIAAPRGYAFGSRYRISGLPGTFTVRDRGGAINGNRIDIWFSSHSNALAWGRRTVTLEALR